MQKCRISNKEALFDKQYIEYIVTDPYFDSGFEIMKNYYQSTLFFFVLTRKWNEDFQVWALIKTKIRNRLLPDTLRKLILVSLVGGQPGLWAQQKLPSWFSYWENTYIQPIIVQTPGGNNPIQLFNRDEVR